MHVCMQIFPLGQSRINNANRHRESLPRPVMGQILRINPYEWSDDDFACTRLEVYGCPLQGKAIVTYNSITMIIPQLNLCDCNMEIFFIFSIFLI